jgi:hypothetical protein
MTSFFFVQLLMGEFDGMGQSIWDYVQGENYHNCDLFALEKKSLYKLIPSSHSFNVVQFEITGS